MIALHVRPFFVVIIDEFRDDVVQVPLAKQNELEQTLVLY